MYQCLSCKQWIMDGASHNCPAAYTVKVGPQYWSWNDKIAVEPFKTDAVEKAGTNKGFATAKQKTELTPLVVVFGSEKIPEGSTVYVRGDLCVEPESKRVYEIDGKKVIFLPVSEVKVVRFWDVTALKAAWNNETQKIEPAGVGG